jgi:hypothetical protein
VETSAPVTATTTVKGGSIAASVLEWFQVAFVGVVSGVLIFLANRILGWLGVQTTDQQKSQLQDIIVNGLNAGAEKAKEGLRANQRLDFSVKSQIVADAIDYTQRHAADTIQALGLNPQSGEAVEAIKARIEAALNDPKLPTPPEITPVTGGGVVNTQPLAPGNA